ncbi:MAG: Holliday junction branch migration protein RuvA, partial [Methylophilaceae bacterium]
MIGSIRGRLVDKSPPWIRVECSGVGYEIEVPMSTLYNLPEVNNEVFLLTHMVVREDAQLLYGFLTAEEKSSFKSLIKVNGIGAKVALSILSGVSIEQFL